MRATILSAALAAALGATALSPSRAEAQVIINPTISSSPYTYWSYPTYYSSYYPGYNYNWTWSSPFGTSYSTTWSNPYNYGTWSWYTPPYRYTGFTGVGYTTAPYYWRGRLRW